ncbi:MAG: hypothetical protein WCA46_16440 [Actinocatenispora sp.]
MAVRKKVLGLAAAGALTLGAALFAATSTASAASVPTSLPTSQFTLSSDYHHFDDVNTALVSKLGTAPVHEVMDHANHDRTAPDSLGLAGYVDGFKFDTTDNGDCKNFPQGITTSRDAVGTTDGGNYDGHQLVLVSWYTMDACSGTTTRSRITLVDWDADYPNSYRKILLVEPTGSAASPNFKDVPIHAGGVSWYGDYLYVADTGHGMRVFNMKKILKTNTGGAAGDIGTTDGTTYYAHNYGYVLPQVGTVTSNTASGTTALVWSSISLDRVSKSIVMNEYTCSSGCTKYPNRAPRAIRFPFATGANTFAASTTSSEALQLPWYKLNGVGSHNGRWWFDSSGDKKLYYWADGKAQSFAWVSGGESLSYWEVDGTDPDLLWSLQETQGHRDVFAVKQVTYGGG